MSDSIFYIPECDSTNQVLKELDKKEPQAEGTVVYTDFQTAGKGQKGNVWESEREQNLLFSMILHPRSIPVNEQFIISQITALAVRDTLSEYVENITVKWPNDIYWNSRKICGMLIENILDENGISSSILGVGVNVNQKIFSGNLRGNPVSLNIITGECYDRLEVLKQIRKRLLLNYEQLRMGESDKIISDYKKNLFTTGKFRDTKTNELFDADIIDVELNGQLILKDSCGCRRSYMFKEVEFIYTPLTRKSYICK